MSTFAPPRYVAWWSAVRSVLSRATKASVFPPDALWAPPTVPGKFVESVNPATYTSRVVSCIATGMSRHSEAPAGQRPSPHPREAVRRHAAAHGLPELPDQAGCDASTPDIALRPMPSPPPESSENDAGAAGTPAPTIALGGISAAVAESG